MKTLAIVGASLAAFLCYIVLYSQFENRSIYLRPRRLANGFSIVQQYFEQTAEDALTQSGRIPLTPRLKMARHPYLAQLQSLVEEHGLSSAGLELSGAFHEAAVAVSDFLLAEQEEGKLNGQIHAPAYSLSVLEAFLVKLGVASRIGLKVNTSSTSYRLFTQFADIVEHTGFNSKESHSFYSNMLITYTGFDDPPLADAGWLNEFLGTIHTYFGDAKGKHKYRHVPWNPFTGYDYTYSVRSLDDDTNNPLTIGIVADWANGAAGSMFVLEELAKQKPDVVIHLGDTYYSGTMTEAINTFMNPMLKAFGNQTPILQVPGNHDYYSGGEGFFHVVDTLKHQDASFFVLRGTKWQIIGMDTGLLDSFQLHVAVGPQRWKDANKATMTFLPDDQLAWVLEQIRVGSANGLKTIAMSHHQFFSRRESLGVANSAIEELSTLPDRLAGIYHTSAFRKKSEDLPGKLPNDVAPAVNTRLLSQFPPDILDKVEAFYWGHEHSSAIFAPYAGIKRGRLMGHGCVPNPSNHDVYEVCPHTESSPWGGPPEILPNSTIRRGKYLWSLGFVTITLHGANAHAQYFEVEQTGDPVNPFKPARIHFEEFY